MSFWDLSDGESAKDTGTDYEVPGGNLAPIPNESDVLAIIDEAKWADKDGNEYLSVRWSVLEPEQYKNRKVFHKLWVSDTDPGAKDEAAGIKKRDKARRMLAAIDANAGGKLARKDGKPSDDDLGLHLCNKPMIIKCMVWETEDRKTGETITGNWVSAVAPKAKGVDVKAATEPAKKAGGGGGGYGGGGGQTQQRRVGMDDEIPF
jgi:hypothetical protein